MYVEYTHCGFVGYATVLSVRWLSMFWEPHWPWGSGWHWCSMFHWNVGVHVQIIQCYNRENHTMMTLLWKFQILHPEYSRQPKNNQEYCRESVVARCESSIEVWVYKVSEKYIGV